MRIAVTGGKGGTGKSTVATALAIELAKTGNVLLVDADVDCPDDHLMLSVKRKKVKDVFQPVPVFDMKKCTKCGKCGQVCKQNSIVFVKGKHPAFVPDMCIGCKACIFVCPSGAIKEGKKKIGTIYRGENYGIHLISGELKIGELASGEMVAETRKLSEEIEKGSKSETVVIDSAAGIGCPVIASITGTDFAVAVTEPTPSALSDLDRVLNVARHFGIPHGIVINKFDLSKAFTKRIEKFAEKSSIPILGKIPYDKKFIEYAIKMKPAVAYEKEFGSFFREILREIPIRKSP
jgi:MinD superfamily P-loop ATPase